MKTLHRRDFIISAALAAPVLTSIGIRTARATGFPDKDIAFVIPDGPGGGFDSSVRALAPAIEKYLPAKVNVLPTNVSGSGGTRATMQVYRAKPDGYTIGIFNIPGMFIMQNQSGASFDLKKLTWLGRIGQDTYALGVGSNSPIKSIADLKALSAVRPVKFTSTGPAGTAYTATRIAAELLGIRVQMITGYKGSSDYVVGAIRGDGDAVITTLPLLRRMQAGGDLRILASFEAHASIPGVEDATTLNQPEIADITLERLVGAPPGLPADVKQTLADALTRALGDPDIVEWAKKTDINLAPQPPEQAAVTLANQANFIEKWKGHLGPN